MAQHLSSVDVEFVSLVDRAAVRDPQNKSEPRRFLFWKSAGHSDPKGDQMSPEELQAALEKSEADATAAKEAQEKAEKERDDARQAQEKAEQEAKVLKDEASEGSDNDDDDDGKRQSKSEGLPPEVQARIEKAEADANARIEKAEKDAAEAQSLAKAEQDRRITGEFIAKAETLNALPQQPSQFGVVLKHAAETLSKEDYDAIESLLLAANEQISKSDLFRAVGADAGGGRLPNDAYAEVQQKAQEIRKSDPKLSQGEAEARVMSEDPELQARYLASVR